LALRLASRWRWRLALFGVVVFRFNINETAVTRFGLEKFTGFLSQHSRRLCTAFTAQELQETANTGRPTRGYFSPFSGNFKQNRS
jgi:hypothetical protein